MVPCTLILQTFAPIALINKTTASGRKPSANLNSWIKSLSTYTIVFRAFGRPTELAFLCLCLFQKIIFWFVYWIENGFWRCFMVIETKLFLIYYSLWHRELEISRNLFLFCKMAVKSECFYCSLTLRHENEITAQRSMLKGDCKFNAYVDAD